MKEEFSFIITEEWGGRKTRDRKSFLRFFLWYRDSFMRCHAVAYQVPNSTEMHGTEPFFGRFLSCHNSCCKFFGVVDFDLVFQKFCCCDAGLLPLYSVKFAILCFLLSEEDSTEDTLSNHLASKGRKRSLLIWSFLKNAFFGNNRLKMPRRTSTDLSSTSRTFTTWFQPMPASSTPPEHPLIQRPPCYFRESRIVSMVRP